MLWIWASAKFLQGVDDLLILIGLLTMQCKQAFTQHFTLHFNENALLYGNSCKRCAVLEQQCFFFTHASFHT